MLVLESRDSLYPYCYSVSLFLKLFQPNIAIEYTADPSFGDEINMVVAGRLLCLSGWEKSTKEKPAAGLPKLNVIDATGPKEPIEKVISISFGRGRDPRLSNGFRNSL